MGKTSIGTTVLALAVFLTAQPLLAQDDDRAQLLKIKAAFERAASSSKLDLLLPYLGEDFPEQMFFDQFQGKDRLQDLLAQRADGLGRTNEVQSYKLELLRDRRSLKFKGGQASASGTTKETIKTSLGEIVCRSKWTATFQRRGGRWTLSSMNSKLDATDPVAMAVANLARNTRSPLTQGKLRLGSLEIDEPNYDGDTAQLRKDPTPYRHWQITTHLPGGE